MMTEMVTVIAVFCIRGRNTAGAAHFLVNLAQMLEIEGGGEESDVVVFTCYTG